MKKSITTHLIGMALGGIVTIICFDLSIDQVNQKNVQTVYDKNKTPQRIDH